MCSEELADHYCNIALQYCNIADSLNNIWLGSNTETAVPTLSLNDLGLTPVFKIMRTLLHENGLRSKYQCYVTAKNSKRKQTRKILNLPE